MTDATRKQRERDKRRAAGMVRIEVWVPAAAVAAVRAAIAAVLNRPQGPEALDALAAIAALEDDIARLQTAHVQMQRAMDDLAAENARLRGADALLGEVWAHDINAIRQHEPEWVMILNRVRNYFVERDDAEFDAIIAPTSGC